MGFETAMRIIPTSLLVLWFLGLISFERLNSTIRSLVIYIAVTVVIVGIYLTFSAQGDRDILNPIADAYGVEKVYFKDASRIEEDTFYEMAIPKGDEKYLLDGEHTIYDLKMKYNNMEGINEHLPKGEVVQYRMIDPEQSTQEVELIPIDEW